ncbi:MAG: hypothetical protein GY913_28110 [Proteobacteria bacterium]|nr:hypothetical protein [Pseudomonadota bacterium]MCP4920776.1 hypothetical protein [Pseudomonadota bacterium]
MTTTTVSLADLITLFYDEYMALYGDEEMASVAAAATINEILAERAAASNDIDVEQAA